MRQALNMTGYTKLFGSIVASTIWRESKETKIVWITMLALANKEGMVEASVPGLADLARVTVEECEEALSKLQSPDPYSRTKTNEGRRIQPVEGGWFVLNHAKYRAKMNADERREYFRKKQQEYRAKEKPSKPVNKCQRQSKTVNDMSTPSTQSEAEAQSEAKKNPPIVPQGGLVDPIPKELPEKLRTQRMVNKWGVWMNVRRGLKRPKSWVILFNEQIDWLSQFDEPTAFEAVSASIRNGWTGLFEPKNNSSRSELAQPELTDAEIIRQSHC